MGTVGTPVESSGALGGVSLGKKYRHHFGEKYRHHFVCRFFLVDPAEQRTCSAYCRAQLTVRCSRAVALLYCLCQCQGKRKKIRHAEYM